MAVHLLRNPRSGRGRRPDVAAEEALAAVVADQPITDLTRSSAEASAQALADALAADEVEHMVVAGGDGLVHLAIQHLAERQIPMTIVPMGTGNDFADAVSRASGPVALEGTRSVDLLRVSTANGEHRWVASILIAGFPASVNRTANRISLPLGPALYTLAALAELPRYRRHQVEFELVDDDSNATTEETDSGMLAIGSTCSFGGGMLACPDALPDDGLLHLTSIEGVGRVGMLRHLLRQKGGSANWHEVRREVGTKIRLATAGIELWGDGEHIGVTPATIEVVPQALTLTTR